MPVKKKTSRKRAGTKKRKTSRRRKPKIRLESGKVFLLTGAIVFICALILAASFILTSPKNQSAEKENQTVYKELPKTEKTKEISELKKKDPVKNSTDKKKKTADSKKTETKKIPPKTEEKKKTFEPKTEPKVEVKTEKKSIEKPVNSLPKKKETKPVVTERPPEFNIPQARNNATIAIIIDDAGRNAANVRKYTSLEIPLTIAVLPKLSQTKECAQIVRNSGKELILHQPMQSKNHNMDPGPGKVTVDMSFEQIYQIVKDNLAELGPGVKGLNNHEGSEVTEDVFRIGAVLDVCLEKGIYFLDSRTSAQTMAPQAALERDMTIYEKAGPYIDNETTREAELKRIVESLEYANKHGSAIVIGHVDKSVNILPGLLKEMYPLMIKKGYKFTTPSRMKK